MQGSKLILPPIRKRQIERQHQDALVEWFKLQHPQHLLIKIPNDLVRGEKQAIRETKNGLVGGAPDLFLAVGRKNYLGMFIEMKPPHVPRGPRATVRANQKIIMERLTQAGYYCVVAWGCDQGRELINEYLR